MNNLQENIETYEYYQQKYIKIRTIFLGTVAKSVNMHMDSMLYNDLQTYNVVQQKDLDSISWQDMMESDIIFIVADLDDRFVMQNILKVIDLLSQYKCALVTILSNIESTQIVKEIRQKSSLLIIEDQEDVNISKEPSLSKKITKIIYALYNLIDIEIEIITCMDCDFSSLVNLNRFFDTKYDLRIYFVYTIEQLSEEIREKERFGSLVDKASKIWIGSKSYNNKNVYALRSIHDLIESNIDEDADFFISNIPYSSNNIKDTQATILTDVLYDTKEGTLNE